MLLLPLLPPPPLLLEAPSPANRISTAAAATPRLSSFGAVLALHVSGRVHGQSFGNPNPHIQGKNMNRSLGNGVFPAPLQKLVGDSFNFGEDNFVGNLAGILRDFSDPQNKGPKISGKISEHFL